MALEQTLSLSSSLLPKHSLLSIPRNRFRIASLSHLDAAKRLRFARRFPKCSAMENFSNYSTSYRKPPEIPWSKELSNSVSLIGTVGTPVEIKHLASGKDVAWTRLAVWKSSTETSWYEILLVSFLDWALVLLHFGRSLNKNVYEYWRINSWVVGVEMLRVFIWEYGKFRTMVKDFVYSSV